MHFFDGFNPKKSAMLGALLGLAAAVMIIGAFAPKAKAADLNKPKKAVEQSDVPYMPPAAKGWSGCGVGAHVGIANADTDTAPVNLGVNGYLGGAEVFCDANWGVFLIGAFASYDRFWGDLHTFAGVAAKSDITIGARVGVLASQSALLYTHAGWSWVDSLGDGNGPKVGAGVEVKLPNAPFFLDLRYTHTMYGDAPVGFVPMNADEVRLGLKYKFSTSK
jgi:opacity protein-like surface antigen